MQLTKREQALQDLRGGMKTALGRYLANAPACGRTDRDIKAALLSGMSLAATYLSDHPAGEITAADLRDMTETVAGELGLNTRELRQDV